MCGQVCNHGSDQTRREDSKTWLSRRRRDRRGRQRI